MEYSTKAPYGYAPTPAEHTQKTALPRTRRANNGNDLAWPYGSAHVAQNGQWRSAHALPHRCADVSKLNLHRVHAGRVELVLILCTRYTGSMRKLGERDSVQSAISITYFMENGPSMPSTEGTMPTWSAAVDCGSLTSVVKSKGKCIFNQEW